MFSNTQNKTVLKISFDQMQMTQKDVTKLYRGIHELGELFFTLPVITGGLFCRQYPSVMTIDSIIDHKTINNDDSKHFIALSENLAKAKDYGRGQFMIVDPMFIRKYLVDVDATYVKHDRMVPQKMVDEKEHICLVLPYCSIEGVYLNDQYYKNPFYHGAMNATEETLKDFSVYYTAYTNFLKKKYGTDMSEYETACELEKILQHYLQFYAKHVHDNPFSKPFHWLLSQKGYLHSLDQQKMNSNDYDFGFFKSEKTLAEIALQQTKSIIDAHPYSLHMSERITRRRQKAMRYYDDPWAKGVYD